MDGVESGGVGSDAAGSDGSDRLGSGATPGVVGSEPRKDGVGTVARIDRVGAGPLKGVDRDGVGLDGAGPDCV